MSGWMVLLCWARSSLELHIFPHPAHWLQVWLKLPKLLQLLQNIFLVSHWLRMLVRTPPCWYPLPTAWLLPQAVRCCWGWVQILVGFSNVDLQATFRFEGVVTLVTLESFLRSWSIEFLPQKLFSPPGISSQGWWGLLLLLGCKDFFLPGVHGEGEVWNDWVLSDGSWTGFASPCLLLKCNWSKVATHVNSRVLKKTETNSRHFRKSNYTVSTCAKRIFSTFQLSDRKQWISKSVFYCTLLSSYSLVARLKLRSLWSLFKGEQMNAFTVRGVNY